MARRIFEYANVDLASLCIGLDELVKKNGGNAASWTDFIDDHYVEPLTDPTKPMSSFKFTIVGLQLMMVFRSLGLVDFVREKNDPTSKVSVLKVEKGIFETLAVCAKSAVASGRVSTEQAERIGGDVSRVKWELIRNPQRFIIN